MGTLVIWKNIDRIEPDFKVVDLVHRLGRIYRKFIGKKIIIQHGKEKNYTDEEINILLDKITNGKLPIQIIEDKTGRPDGLFIDIVPKISLKLITYNLKHAFFMSVYR